MSTSAWGNRPVSLSASGLYFLGIYMDYLRKCLWIVAALSLAAFALPSTAADKLFNISVTSPSPDTMPAGTATPVTIRTTNSSPGNSVIGSMILTLGSPSLVGPLTLTVTSPANLSLATCPSSTSNGPVPAGSLCFNVPGQGIKAGGGKLDITISVNVPSGFSCTNTVWIAQAFTGSFSQTTFSDATTQTQPYSTTPAYVGCQTIACGGTQQEPPPPPNNLVGSDDPGYAQIWRSVFNKDGSSGPGCTIVPFGFDNSILTNGAKKNKVNLTWYTQPTAVFVIAANSQLYADPAASTTGWSSSPNRPQVGWLNDGAGNRVYVDGQTCLGTNPSSSPAPNLPGPYGKLVGSLLGNNSPTSITIDTSSPPANVTYVPLPTIDQANNPITFPLVIGTERLLATYSGTANVYNVMRGNGVTPITPHSAGAFVMSTPLPLLKALSTDGPTAAAQQAAGYFVGMQAQMCIQESGSAASAIDYTGLPMVYDFATAIDIGDGGVKIGP